MAGVIRIDSHDAGAGAARSDPDRGRFFATTRRSLLAGLLGAAAGYGGRRAALADPPRPPRRATIVDLDVDADAVGRAIWISEDNAIVGEQLSIANSSIDPASQRLVLWHDGATVDLTALGVTMPQWFDERGDFIAWRGAESVRYRVRTGEIDVVPGLIPRLRPPSGFVEAWPCARNRDAVVGILYPEPGGAGPRGFVAADGGMTIVGLAPGGDSSWINDINADGLAVGGPAANRLGAFAGCAFRYDLAAGAITDLGALPGYDGSVALGINRPGDVVGFAHHPLDQTLPPTRACLWRAGSANAIALDETLPLRTSWRLLSAFDINDAGAIVGSGWAEPTPRDRPFLLRPM